MTKLPTARLREQSNQEKLEERELWYKLVVKIIRWKDQALCLGITRATDKITTEEWNTYHQGIVKINTTKTQEKVLSDLRKTEELIKKNNGFKEG
ncbi:hypothetical protein A2688_01600 [Candidatus Daviesbacteria bacterium RIFCSPHIGHO2_01_FULL_38_8]|nr:MAG: hypothetical protein A2688_01600 [Candidatus Daviesbacteria bacterium RIFCSPHIGHO2_01_FULL_38_8]